MPNPFSSEYAPDTGTGAAIAPTPQTNRAPETPPITSSEDLSRELGFEPERYGLGKPTRITIRGKITRE